ncbi:zinc finger CCHC domain-containing protein 7-like [Mytilus edulis]|uniref:zinc finger CCHC domain-containing protein 7-like n=1 Tax=Mytilus edulis TaxID=6550 RepID=UPI0039EE5365
MFASSYDQLEDDGFKGSDSEHSHCSESDREEIEQALYAQIHYCQDDAKEENDKHFLFQCSENGELKQSEEQSEDKKMTIKSSINDSCITISSGTEGSPCKRKKSKKKRLLINSFDGLKKTEKGDKEEVIHIYSQTDTDAISISSDKGIEVDSSDIDLDIDSDCMMLDESCDDMGDIVLNVDHNQRTMLDNLTVRDVGEKVGEEKWNIIDRDRFVGNPLLGRYYRSSSVRCHNCNETGHLSKVCPQPKKLMACYLCGDEGHTGRNCKNPICFNCNTPGHIINECTKSRRSKYIDCHRCQMYGHTAYECPEIWRQFHLTTVHGPLVRGKDNENPLKHCSNCAGDDHFDHDCEEERMDRHTLPSCTLISQYRKSDVRVAKRKKEMHEEDKSSPKKIRKIEKEYSSNSGGFKITKNYEEDFDRSSYIETDDYSYTKKKKKKTTWTFKEKKPDRFRKMMDMDLYTSEKKTYGNRKVKSDKNKLDKSIKRKEKERKKKNKKRLSLEEEYYGPLPKKKKNKLKKNKKDGPSIKQKTSTQSSNRGFNIKDLRFTISNKKR